MSTAHQDRPTAVQEDQRARRLLAEIVGGSGAVSVLAVLLALLGGAILIAVTDSATQNAASYFFGRPGDTIAAAWHAVADAYGALLRGAVYDPNQSSFALAIRPLTETLNFATPLIVAGLGVAITFRVGLFNIGGRGQILIAAAAAGWIGATLDLPWGLHLVVAVAAGVAGGAAWAGIAGVLKARTGAHEVIVTIMLNYVAFYLVSWMLRTPGLLQAPGSGNPKSGPMREAAVLPRLFGDGFNLHLGFVLVLGATVLLWWVLNRSALGFRFRAVGENPRAARAAGISVPRVTIQAMLIAGGLMGLAGAIQVLGTVPTGFTAGIDAGIGFEAITVALLGRSRPSGVLAAGVLFGAFKAGGFSMQAAEGIPVELILVIQSLAVLFIAAPPLVRSIFRLPDPGALASVRPALRRSERKGA